ncbi:FxSxx-COOH system tetratricopeptide repeat protein [Actinocorallia herbida]|uniref:FxSxx-COOH system tetratricopeptide repeat protein n=1 Tax=Actinocorallia herbida TaxID=58109 RepID=UPI0014770740|nr:FxSxx-COOH system tetratricopeptide repeat protein [Actinocorallia herbida]
MTQRGELGYVPRVWGKVPLRNRNFTGRERELELLKQSLVGQQTAVVPQALRGMGGVGKTQLAVEYAHRNKHRYDLVWWIPADQPSLIASTIAALSPELGLGDVNAQGVRETAAAVINALRRGEPYGNWLLIFDNAGEPRDLDEFIPADSGHVLITSRNPDWKTRVETVEVDVFDRAESIEFLNRRVRRQLGDAEASRLAERLGDLPLALEQAGALQAEAAMEIGEYLELLAQKPTEAMGLLAPPDYPQSMADAWLLSTQGLERALPEALELLKVCAFFGPEPIPVDIFRRGSVHDDSLLSRTLSDPVRRSMAIRMIGKFALATIEDRQIHVHRLVQSFLKDTIDPAEYDSYKHHVHQLLAGAAPTDPDQESRWPQFAELVPHVRPSELAACATPKVRQFAVNLVRYLISYGDTASARAFVDDFISAWEDKPLDGDPSLLIARNRLASILRVEEGYEAAYRLRAEALQQARNEFGPVHPVTLALQVALGTDLRGLGDFAGALAHDTEARRRHEEVFGTEHPRTWNIVHNQALDLVVNSRYPEAREQHRQIFELQSGATSGVSKIEVLTSWGGLARALRLCGDLDEARFLSEDAYDFGKEALGSEHLRTLQVGIDLSIALRRAGEHDEALSLIRQVHASHAARFPRDPQILSSANALANALRMVGEFDEAAQIMYLALTGYPLMYREGHPYALASAGNAAILHRLRGDVAEARRINETSLAGLREQLGFAHDYTLTVAVNLASDLSALGLLDEACELGQRCHTAYLTLFGPDDPATLVAGLNLARDLQATGRGDGGFDISLELLAGRRGADHPEIVDVRAGHRLNPDFDAPPI